jgi:hypothetical protein
MSKSSRGYSAEYPDGTLVVHGDGTVMIVQGSHATTISKEMFFSLAQLFCAVTWGSFACGFTPGEENAWLQELTPEQGQLVNDFIQGRTDHGFFHAARELFGGGE